MLWATQETGTGTVPNKADGVSGRKHLRIVIGDPDPLARRAVRDLLQDQDSGAYAVPGEASTGTEAVELCRYYTPDVATLEADMVDMDCQDATRRIQHASPTVRIVVFSREANPDIQLESVGAGAAGFVEKSSGVAELAKAIQSVVAGNAVIPPQTVTRLVEALRTVPNRGIGLRPVRSSLTQREWEILDLMSQGLDTHAMAERLVLSAETIYSHVKRILQKLDVHSRSEAIEVARTLRDPFAVRRDQPAVQRSYVRG